MERTQEAEQAAQQHNQRKLCQVVIGPLRQKPRCSCPKLRDAQGQMLTRSGEAFCFHQHFTTKFTHVSRPSCRRPRVRERLWQTRRVRRIRPSLTRKHWRGTSDKHHFVKRSLQLRRYVVSLIIAARCDPNVKPNTAPYMIGLQAPRCARWLGARRSPWILPEPLTA